MQDIHSSKNSKVKEESNLAMKMENVAIETKNEEDSLESPQDFKASKVSNSAMEQQEETKVNNSEVMNIKSIKDEGKKSSSMKKKQKATPAKSTTKSDDVSEKDEG